MAAKATTKTYRPEQIAETLGISGKVVRQWLRKEFPRPSDAKGTSWVLSAEQAKAALSHFKNLQSSTKEED